MTDLGFEVVDARTEPHAAVPTIMFRIRAEEADGRRVHAAALRCQIRIEPQRRRYSEREEEKLYELFGETPQWGNSLRPFLWTHVSTTIGGFDGATEFDLPVECTYDFEVAGAKYLHALGDGDIPLILLFSGTVFTQGESGFCGRAALVVGRGLLPAAGGGLADHDGRLLPRQRLHPPRARHAGRPAALPGPARPAHLGPGPRAAAQRGRGGAAVTGTSATRTGDVAPAGTAERADDRFATAGAVADAVLYEGYVLYPYRASSRKNQVRFQWGVLTPRAFSEADGSERWSMRTECLVDPRGAGANADLHVRMRCLQTQRRRVEALGRGAAGSRSAPSMPSRSTGRATSSGTRRSTASSTCPLSPWGRPTRQRRSWPSRSRAAPRPSTSTRRTARSPAGSSGSGCRWRARSGSRRRPSTPRPT